MLIRQADERRGFVKRIKEVEKDLRTDYPRYFQNISSAFPWFKSVVLGWILFLESIAGFLLFLCHTF